MRDKEEIMEYVRFITDTENLTISQVREYSLDRVTYNYNVKRIEDVEFFVDKLCKTGTVTLIGHIVTSNHNTRERSAILELQTYY